jgi:predicted dienelactone hydrolase
MYIKSIHPLYIIIALGVLLACQDDLAQKKLIQDATLQDLTLQDATLQDATLQDAILQDATLQDATLQDAILQDAILQDQMLSMLENQGYQDDAQSALSLGKYAIGYQTLTFEYTLSDSMAEVLNAQINEVPAQTKQRKLKISVWYPADPNRLDSVGFARYPLLANRQVAYAQAPIADLSKQVPLYVYSHGAKSWPELGASNMEFLASHGWVAIGVEHANDQIQTATLPRPVAMYALRPLDIQKSIDFILDQTQNHPFARLINPEMIMAAGHSYGGYTTFALGGAAYDNASLTENCQNEDGFCDAIEQGLIDWLSVAKDSRIKAIIPQAAGDFRFFHEGVGAIQLPTLMMSAKLDQNCTEEGSNLPYQTALFQTSSPRFHLSFNQAGHASFTVVCQHIAGLELNNGCGPEFTPSTEVLEIVNAYQLTFARAYLGQQAQALTFFEGETLNPLIESNDRFIFLK